MNYTKTWNLRSSDEMLEQEKLYQSLLALAKLACHEPDFGWDTDKKIWYWTDPEDQSINFTDSTNLFVNKVLNIIYYHLGWHIESVRMQLHKNQIDPWSDFGFLGNLQIK